MSVRVINSLLILLCAVLCTTGCYRASPPLEDDPLEQPDAVTDTTQTKPTPTPVAGPATPNNSPLIMQLGDLEIDELSTYPTLAFRIFDFDDEISCQEVVPESSNQNAIQTTAEGEPNESAMTYGDITITGGDSTKCGIAISTRYAAPDPVTISLTLSDGKGASKSYFDVTVLSTNTAPTPDGSGQVNISMQEDDSGKSILLSEFSDTTPRGSPARLAFESVTNPNKGVLGLYPSDAGTGGQNIIYTPNANENGSDSFSYKVCDNDPGVPKCSAVQTVNISIAAVNDAPTIGTIDSQTTSENQSVSFSFDIADVDSTLSCGNSISYSHTHRENDNASLISASGAIVFSGTSTTSCIAKVTPANNESGSSHITIIVSDGAGGKAEKEFVFNVEGVNHVPTMSDIGNQNATEEVDFGVTFDIDDDRETLECNSNYLSYSAVETNKISSVTWTKESENENGRGRTCKGTVTPAINATGNVTITFEVTDKASDSPLKASKSFNVSITNINDAPTGTVKCANGTNDIFKVGKATDNNWSFNCNGVTDADNEEMTYKLIKKSEVDLNGFTCADTINSTKVNNTEGQFSGSFSASPNYGTCIYNVKACDAAGLCTELSSFKIEITHYQLDIKSVSKPILGPTCVVSSEADFSFSGNISSMDYSSIIDITDIPEKTGSIVGSPFTFSHNLPDGFWFPPSTSSSRTRNSSQSDFTAKFSITEGTFNSTVGGGDTIGASKYYSANPTTPTAFTFKRELESIQARWPESYTYKSVNLDGFQPDYVTTPNVCSKCTEDPLISLSSGSAHSCVIETNTLRCAGENGQSQLGTGDTTKYTYPKEISISGFAAHQVSAGKNFTCLYGTSSSTPQIRCAGNNSLGQLGHSNSTTNQFTTAITPPANHTPIAVSAAKFGDFACGIFNDTSGIDGKIYCWGKNDKGQLGNNTTTTPATGTLVGLAGSQGNSRFFSLSLGKDHACAIKKDTSNSKVYCWGAGNYGKLSTIAVDGVYSNSSTPVLVSLDEANWVQVVVGESHSCALQDNGKVWCWGLNDNGQLGIGWPAPPVVKPLIESPIKIANLENDSVVQLSAGALHTCALLDTFAVYCWGWGSKGQLGLGAFTTDDETDDDCDTEEGVQNVEFCKKLPVQVTSPANTTFVSISAGAEHTCAVSVEGKGYCWGRNSDGRLGISTLTDVSSPSNMCSNSSNCTALTTLRPRMCSTYSIP